MRAKSESVCYLCILTQNMPVEEKLSEFDKTESVRAILSIFCK